MTNVTMKALDTLFISSIGPDSIPPNGEFEVTSAEAERLEKAGLAKRVGGAKKEEKAEPAAPENKMEPAPENKGIIGPGSFDRDGRNGPGGSLKGDQSSAAIGASRKRGKEGK